jgi:hypothetical protein
VIAYSGGTISDGDTARVESLINAMTDRMERECSRKFKARDFFEWYNISSHQGELVLRNYPIIRAPIIACGELPCMSVSYAGSAIEATISATLDRLTLTTYDASGTRSQNDLLFSANGSVSALVAAISGVSGFTASTTVNVPSFRICPTSGFDLLTTPAQFTYPHRTLYNPATDYETGVVSYRQNIANQWNTEPPTGRVTLPPGMQYIFVEYRAGFETIPDDLAMLCNELVVDAYNRSNRDATVTSETLDQYSYTLADAVKFSQSIRDRLSRYMRFAVGAV